MGRNVRMNRQQIATQIIFLTAAYSSQVSVTIQFPWKLASFCDVLHSQGDYTECHLFLHDVSAQRQQPCCTHKTFPESTDSWKGVKLFWRMPTQSCTFQNGATKGSVMWTKTVPLRSRFDSSFFFGVHMVHHFDTLWAYNGYTILPELFTLKLACAF